MGLTVLEVLERTRNETLQIGGVNIPPWDTLSAALNATDLTFALSGTRDVVVPKDSLLEFDDASMELALNRITSGSSVSVYQRGYLESTAATHASGTRVIVNPPWPQIVLFNALKGLIASLYSYGIYRRNLDSSRTFSATAPIVLDALDKDVGPVMWFKTGNRWQKLRKGTEFEVIHETSPIEIQAWGGPPQGAALRILTKRGFTQPSALTDDLSTLGVPDALQPFLSLGVAGMVLQGREVPEVQAEHIRRSLANQNIPIGSRISVAAALWRTFLNQVSLERGRLLEANPPAIEFVS